jgi:hypothetical protein
VQAGDLAPDMAAQQLAAYSAVFQALAGHEIQTVGSVLTFGAGNQMGTVSMGAVAGCDVVTLHVAGSQRDQRTIRTGGGDYAEGAIDKRQGAFVDGSTVHGDVIGGQTMIVAPGLSRQDRANR